MFILIGICVGVWLGIAIHLYCNKDLKWNTNDDLTTKDWSQY